MKLKTFLNKYYYIKNIYTLGSFLRYSDKVSLNIPEEMRDVFFKHLDERHFVNDGNGLTVNLIKTDNKFDSYSLNITFYNRIDITYSNIRSLSYALILMNELIDKVDDEIHLPVILINDEASFLYRGIIEGYYGEPWTLENRIDLVDFMQNHRLNTYMYAPKCDSYHRDKWYMPYPEKELEDFKTLIDLMKNAYIDFYYCISPGHAPEGEKGFVYVGDEDFIRLYKKLDQLIDLGVESFGLLLDDIDYNLTGENLEIFKRPGLAHSHICNKVYNYLKTKVNNLKFVMCPTEYHQIGDSQYRCDLRENLDKDIYVYWTGDHVCAEVITEEQINKTQKAYGDNRLMLWENFPVTDFTYGVRQYIAPLKNRSVDMGKLIDGFMINPMMHYEISKIAMVTECHYAWNSYKYDSERSFKMALKEVGADFYRVGKDYIEYNLPSMLTYGNLDYEKQLVEKQDTLAIKEYYNKVIDSVNGLLKLDYPIIEELRPWLNRTLKEKEVVFKILDEKITHQEIIEFLEDIKFSGSELFDYLVSQKGLLTEEEFTTLIKKRRGNPWYRVWEHKRG